MTYPLHACARRHPEKPSLELKVLPVPSIQHWRDEPPMPPAAPERLGAQRILPGLTTGIHEERTNGDLALKQEDARQGDYEVKKCGNRGQR